MHIVFTHAKERMAQCATINSIIPCLRVGRQPRRPLRTRHVHRRWFFVRHYEDSQKIKIKEIAGANNHANFLTKAVGGAAFARDRAYSLGMR